MRIILVLFASTALAACGTSQAMRDLSTAQIAAIDVSISNATSQRDELVRLANLQCAAHEAEQRALYAAHRRDQLQYLDSADDDDERVEILELLEARRDTFEATIEAKNAECRSLAAALDTQVEHLRAIKTAQQTIDQAVQRDDPLSRMGRRLIGEEQYNTVEERLNLLQNAYAENQDTINALTAGIFGNDGADGGQTQ